MKKSAEELLTDLRSLIGEERLTEDGVVSLIEDITDSVSEDAEGWKAKYEALDESWKKKYVDRFFGADDEEVKEEVREETVEEKETTFDDIIKDEGE